MGIIVTLSLLTARLGTYCLFLVQLNCPYPLPIRRTSIFLFSLFSLKKVLFREGMTTLVRSRWEFAVILLPSIQDYFIGISFPIPYSVLLLLCAWVIDLHCCILAMLLSLHKCFVF